MAEPRMDLLAQQIAVIENLQRQAGAALQQARNFANHAQKMTDTAERFATPGILAAAARDGVPPPQIDAARKLLLDAKLAIVEAEESMRFLEVRRQELLAQSGE